MPRIHQTYFEAARFQNLKQRDPVHSVDSIATVLIPHCVSQPANAWRSCVKVGKDRTFSTARSAGTATKISVAPMSIPAASGRITGNTALLFLLFCLRFPAIHLLLYEQSTARAAQKRALF
jgi:hypothetical protein